MEGKYLITTDNWFLAPDGQEYAGVWGEVKVVSTKEALGFDPNRNSANWFLKVGTEDNHVFVAGCQIHYAVRSEKRPFEGRIKYDFGDGEKDRQTKIYFTEGETSIPESPGDREDNNHTIGFMGFGKRQNDV